MLTGKRYRLKREALSIKSLGDQRTALMLPAGSIISVMSGPRPDDARMLDILCDGVVLVMFAVDVIGRGEDITDSI